MQQSPDLAEIRAFVAVADRGSFVAAGRALDRHPTVLSRRLQALEARLGVHLVERSSRSITLTEAGALYLGRVRSLLDGIDDADRQVASLAQGEPQGHLRVALPSSFARRWMAPLITGFLAAHPRVSLEACYSNGFVDLIAGRFDLAVRLAHLPDSRLVARKVGTRRRLICGSPEYLYRSPALVRPEDLVGHSGLCFTGRANPYRWPFVSAEGERVGIDVSCRIASDDADLLLEAAILGLGLFCTTDWHAGPLLGSGALLEMLTDWRIEDEGAIYVVTHSTSGRASKVKAFADWIADGLAGEPWNRPATL